MFQSIKDSLTRAARALRVRNANQLHGPTLLRTYGSGAAPHVFAMRGTPKAQGDLSTRPNGRM